MKTLGEIPTQILHLVVTAFGRYKSYVIRDKNSSRHEPLIKVSVLLCTSLILITENKNSFCLFYNENIF